MISPRPRLRAGWLDAASGRLRWTCQGQDLVAGRYRIRLLDRRRWEATCRGRLLGRYTHRSVAIAAVEHHRRERLRFRRITTWGVVAGLALLGAILATARLSSPEGFFLMAGAVWLFVGSVARCIAATSRNLLDPYRPRDPWEPRDWYNH